MLYLANIEVLKDALAMARSYLWHGAGRCGAGWHGKELPLAQSAGRRGAGWHGNELPLARGRPAGMARSYLRHGAPAGVGPAAERKHRDARDKHNAQHTRENYAHPTSLHPHWPHSTLFTTLHTTSLSAALPPQPHAQQEEPGNYRPVRVSHQLGTPRSAWGIAH